MRGEWVGGAEGRSVAEVAATGATRVERGRSGRGGETTAEVGEIEIGE